MSVYIPGMELPKSCFTCPFRRKVDPDNIMCIVTREVFEETFAGTIETRSRGNCPLIPVPEHGDLIDRDALMKILSKVIDINASIEQRNEATDQERRCLWWFEQQIGIAPTIIPSDKGEEG